VLQEVLKNDFESFIKREMRERHDFLYPPFYRLIQIQLKHKKNEVLAEAAQFFAERLRTKLGDRVLGPAVPGVSRVRTYYLIDIVIKLGLNSKGLIYTKELVREINEELKLKKGMGSTRVLVNVDPY
jgi:primosomal protein N' (replication factor Y)